MKGSVLLALCLGVIGATAHAQECPDLAPYQKARETIEDLGRASSLRLPGERHFA